ncbi:hypothetical protein N8987_01675 [Crocinitomix sp.]|nr:hypothetical protein [Crocinitomix sp.]
MKRIIFGTAIAFIMTACGGSESAEETTETPVDTAAVIELENATKTVEDGLNQLEDDVNQLNADVDSLLNGI